MTPATVPMISPDGQSGDIPQARAQEAIAAGFKPAMVMTSPDGQLGYIPHDRAAEALKAGFKVGQPAVQGMGGQGFDEQHPIAARVMNGVDAVGRGIQKGAYAIPDAVNLVIDASEHPENHQTVHNAQGVKAKAQAILSLNNPLPPDQGQGMTNRVLEGAGQIAGASMTAPVLDGESLKVQDLKNAGAKIADAVPSPSDAITNRLVGPQMRTMADAAKLHPNVVRGVEDVFRAAAPTGMNQQFRANAYAAAGDLAEIARATNLKESAGGIITPDMRVHATVDAINEHLDKMYQEERAPKIAKYADAQVRVGVGSDATEGLKYLSRRAGEAEVRSAAASALEEGTLSLADADKLAMAVNQKLKGFESMTAADRAAASATDRNMNSIKTLDKQLSSAINNELAANGEKGLQSYERRFAALSEVRDQLSTRMNAVELKRSAPLMGAVKSVMGGKSGIASASQAAVADVNIGRRLQNGLKRLGDSGIVPER